MFLNDIKNMKKLEIFKVVIVIILATILTTCKKDIELERISLDEDFVLLKIGERTKLIPNFYPENATIDKIDWYSTDYDIVTVIGGNIIGLKIGTAKIIVSVRNSNLTTTCIVNVVDDILLPKLTTTATNIGTNTATLGGEIIDAGTPAYTERGVCYATTQYPVIIKDNKIIVAGSGTGSFTTNVSGLTENTEYYVRAYATNTEGTAYGEQIVFKTNNTGSTVYDPEMISVTGGTFTMGSTDGEDYGDELPNHQVTLSSYKIGKYEVTQAQWEEVMAGNPSVFKASNLPVENVSWNDIVGTSGNYTEINGIKYYENGFIYKLNQLTGKQYRLPTEAEWEYAARGGMHSANYKYCGSNNYDDVAWCLENSSGTTHNVGMKQANELGIYDMGGNVFEWCSDWLGSYSSSSQTNPTGAVSGSARVIRGGSWYDVAHGCRVSDRNYPAPLPSDSHVGLRLVLAQ